MIIRKSNLNIFFAIKYTQRYGTGYSMLVNIGNLDKNTLVFRHKFMLNRNLHAYTQE